MRRVRVVVTGRVQGVGFRWGAREAARDRDVTGWVRNAVDGSVEAEVEGDDDAVASMLAWLREGPRFARVHAVDVAELTPTGSREFEVRDSW